MTWNGVEPSLSDKQYRIDVDTADFTSVGNMEPSVVVADTSAGAAGLDNDTLYYFAVVTENISGGIQTALTTVSATPVADTFGPDVSEININGSSLENGAVVTGASIFTLNATDPAGVGRVEFPIDGVLDFTDLNGADDCAFEWDIHDLDNGPYTLTTVAYDTLGNRATHTFDLTIAMGPPISAPVIHRPIDSVLVNTPQIAVSGNAEKWTEVLPYNNGVPTGDSAPADENGVRLYRSDAAQITSAEGLVPLIDQIPGDVLAVADPKPSPTDHCYVVTAVDGVGNESGPSNDFYLNFTLLPVADLTLVQTDQSPAEVT